MSAVGKAGVLFGRGRRKPGSRRGLHKVLLAVVVVALVASVTPLVSKSDVVAAEEAPPFGVPAGARLVDFHVEGTIIREETANDQWGSRGNCAIWTWTVFEGDLGSGTEDPVKGNVVGPLYKEDVDFFTGEPTGVMVADDVYAQTAPSVVPDGQAGAGQVLVSGVHHVATLAYRDSGDFDPGAYSVQCTMEYLETTLARLIRADESYRYWLGPDGNGPLPRCEVTSQFGPGGSEIGFRAWADQEDGGGYLQQWSFSDGTTSNANLVQKVATEPGTFSGTFRIWRVGEDLDRSVTCDAEVAAPELGVSVRLEDTEGAVVHEPVPGQELVAVMRVSAGQGVGALSSVRPTGDLLSVTGALEVVEAPQAPPVEGITLQPDQSHELRWRLRAAGAGDFGLSTQWSAVDAIGRTVGPVPGSLLGKVPGLLVSVQQLNTVVLGKDNNGDGEIDGDDEIVDVQVTVENVSDAPVTSVGPIDLSDPLQFTSRIEGLAVKLEAVEVPPERIASIEANDSATLLYRYRASDRVSADATAVIRGVQGGREVASHGKARLSVGKDLWAEVSIAPEARPYRSGQTVRLNGTIKNVTEVLDVEGNVIEEGFPVGVMLQPKVSGNAAGGHVFDPAVTSRTPTNATAFLLAPGEELDVGAVLGTLEIPDGSAAEVTYEAFVWRHDVEPPETPVMGDETNVEWVRDGSSSDHHSIPLGAVPVEGPDPYLTCPSTLSFLGYVSCRFSAGAFKFTAGTWELAKIVAYGGAQYFRAYYGVLSTQVWACRQISLWLLGDAEAMERLAFEIANDLQALKTVGVQSLQGISVSAAAIMPALEQAVHSIVGMFERGDLRAIAGGMAEFTGENIDAVAGLGVLVRQRAAAKILAGASGADNAARVALEESLQSQADSLAGRVSDAVMQGRSITKGGVLRSGDDVTNLPAVWKAAYGARVQDVKNLLKIAADEDVILAFRSRSPHSADLLDANQAWPKPGGVSIKTVNDIDRKYLGYLDEWDAKAVLVEPPVKWAPPGPDRDALVDAYLNRFGDLSSPSDFSRDLRNSVRERLETRLDEWPKQLQKFSDYADNGIDVNFYADKQGLSSRLIPNDKPNRAARVTTGEIGATADTPRRAVFHLEMEGPNGGDFRAIVGDIDFLGVFHRDGSVVTDIAKRTRIYKQLRSLIGMQHGESFTYQGSQSLRDEFLRCCTADAEAMLAATPDKRLIATHFEDNLSVLTAGPNAAMASTTDPRSVAVMTGLTTQAYSDVTGSKGLELPSLTDYLVGFVGSKVVPNSPGEIAKSLAGLETKIRETEKFNREKGKALRPNQKGQLEQYRPPGNTPAPKPRVVGQAEVAGPTLRVSRAEPVQAADIDDPSTELGAAYAGVVADGYVNPVTGVGAEGGRWEVVDPDEVLAGGDHFEILPTTYIGDPADVGGTTLDILTPAMLRMDPSTPFFRVGDKVVVDPGGPYEETATVAAIGEEHLELAAALRHPHDTGTRVILPRAEVAGPQDPTTPTTPPPTTPPTKTTTPPTKATTASTKTTPGETPGVNNSGTNPAGNVGDSTAAEVGGTSAVAGGVKATGTGGGSLAFTGGSIGATVVIASLLLAIGTYLVARRRRFAHR